MLAAQSTSFAANAVASVLRSGAPLGVVVVANSWYLTMPVTTSATPT
jgi:hypothetical protein